MDPRWRWFLPGYVWASPCFIVGFALGLVLRARWVWEKGCLTGYVAKIPGGNITAQTWGWLILKRNGSHEATTDVHERVHVVQFFLLGVFFWVFYGCDYGYQRARGFGHWLAYFRIRLERQAYRLQENPNAWGR